MLDTHAFAILAMSETTAANIFPTRITTNLQHTNAMTKYATLRCEEDEIYSNGPSNCAGHYCCSRGPVEPMGPN